MEEILYSAVVLTEDSKNYLLSKFNYVIPEDWKIYADHMTIAFGQGLESVDKKLDLGKIIDLKVVKLGISDKAIAVKVEGYVTLNNIAHVTLAVNDFDGGKPYMSNLITDWYDCENIIISGIIKEIIKG